MKKKKPFIRNRITIRGDDVTGVDQIQNAAQGLASFFDDVEELSKDLTLRAAKMIIEESNRLVPRDTNALAESWVAEAVETQRGNYKAVAAYGGLTRAGETANAPGGIVDYAVIVHEDLEAIHLNGEAKFLEKGAALAKPRMEAEIIAELRELASD